MASVAATCTVQETLRALLELHAQVLVVVEGHAGEPAALVVLLERARRMVYTIRSSCAP